MDRIEFLKRAVDAGDFDASVRQELIGLLEVLEIDRAALPRLAGALIGMVQQHCTKDGKIDDGGIRANIEATNLLEELGFLVRE